jgi:UTP:GlnB (protein PII) uridylyltransferase
MGSEAKRSKEELIAEIQRKVAYLVATDDYTAEEKEAIARRFFQALEEEE